MLGGVAVCAGGTKAKGLNPLPCLHIAGSKDTTVKFKNQEATIERIRDVSRGECRVGAGRDGDEILTVSVDQDQRDTGRRVNNEEPAEVDPLTL